MSDISTITPLRKIDILSLSNQQLQIVSRLGMGRCVHSSFSALGFCLARTSAGLVHVCSLHESVCASALPYLEDTASLESSTISGAYSLSTSFSEQIPEP